jgi:hypothetical protein
MSQTPQPIVRVVHSQCAKLSDLICNLERNHKRIPTAKEEEIRHSLPGTVAKNLYFSVIAICHQTTPHGLPRLEGSIAGKLAVGWDYLLNKWILATTEDSELITPHRLSRMTANDIETILRDENKGSTITGTQARAELLNDLGNVMLAHGWQNVQEIFDEAGGQILGTEAKPGLLDKLGKFRAYGADPVQKKTYYFLALMANQGLWSYADPEHLGSPVDYHEVRGHLRYGTVEVVNKELIEKLLKHEEVTEADDVAIRGAVFEAVRTIAELSGRNANDLHYFFWNMFRNCCRRDVTHCEFCDSHPSLPVRYEQLKPHHCIFSDDCSSARSTYKLLDPIVNTTFY